MSDQPPVPPAQPGPAPHPSAAPQPYRSPVGAPYGGSPAPYTGGHPQGYAPPYAQSAPGSYADAVAPRGTEKGPRTLGLVALLAGIAAAVIAPVIGAIAAWDVGLGATENLVSDSFRTTWDLSILTPVRDSVLLGEIAFWGGTVLGLWAIVQGIVAIVKNRGRGLGIAGVAVAAVGPVIYVAVVYAVIVFGVAAGAASLAPS